MSKKGIWGILFWLVTAGAVGMELYASFDASENTVPWTYYIVDYVPAPVWHVGALILAAWLGPHLVKYYRLRRGSAPEVDWTLDGATMRSWLKTDAGNRAGRTLAHGAVAAALVGALSVVLTAVEPQLLQGMSEGKLDAYGLAQAAGVALVTAGIAYLRRRYADPSRLPTKPPVEKPLGMSAWPPTMPPGLMTDSAPTSNEAPSHPSG